MSVITDYIKPDNEFRSTSEWSREIKKADNVLIVTERIKPRIM